MRTVDEIRKSQSAYYNGLFASYGPTVDAVASGKQVYKDLRYEKLSQVFQYDTELTLHDVGFGLGHYYEFLKARFPDKTIVYSGSEVVPEFVTYCVTHYPTCVFHERDLAQQAFADRYDYLVFGGTFYHLAGTPREMFGEYAKRALLNAFGMCRRGIAFNFLTGFCDYFYDHLYYAVVSEAVTFVAENLSRFFTLDHAYPLYEFTMCVYKESYVASRYPGEEFDKYVRRHAQNEERA